MRDVVLLDNVDPQAKMVLEEKGFNVIDAQRSFGDALSAFQQFVGDRQIAAILLRSGTQLTAEWMPVLREMGVKLIVRCGAGIDNIDHSAASANGVVVENTIGMNANAVAEKTIVYAGMLLHRAALAVTGITCCRAIEEFIQTVQLDGGANQQALSQAATEFVARRTVLKGDCMGAELSSQTFGVIGYCGQIGHRVALKALALGAKVFGHDIVATPDIEGLQRVERVDFNKLMALSTVITLHLPLSDETRGLIGESEFSLMGQRPFPVLVNCARAGMIDLNVAAKKLRTGRLLGFASDVDDPAHPVFSLPNAFVTPHIGAMTQESVVNCAVAGARQTVSFICSGAIVNGINFSTAELAGEWPNGVLAIFHNNVPDMIGQIGHTFGGRGVNINSSTNVPGCGDSHETSCILIAPDRSLAELGEVVAELQQVSGVIRVVSLGE